MKCNNLKCSARREPDIPCWQIAERKDAYHTVSNTCRDCIVYVQKHESSLVGRKKLQDILRQRVNLGTSATDHQICVL